MEQAQRDEVPSYTKELIPNIVDHLAKVQPHKLYAEYPISSLSYQEGYRKITYGDFANAVNGMAWWLHEALGPGENFEVLAYIGPNDLRYTALILGAVKVGYLVRNYILGQQVIPLMSVGISHITSQQRRRSDQSFRASEV